MVSKCLSNHWSSDQQITERICGKLINEWTNDTVHIHILTFLGYSIYVCMCVMRTVLGRQTKVKTTRGPLCQRFFNCDAGKTKFMLSSCELSGMPTLLVEEKEKNLFGSDDLTFTARALYPTEKKWTLIKWKKKPGEWTALCQPLFRKQGLFFNCSYVKLVRS